MNKIIAHKKLQNHIKAKQQDEFNMIRTSTNKSSNNGAPFSHQQYHDKIKSLMNELEEEKRNSDSLKQIIKEYQMRGIEKQKQFYKVIRDNSKEVYRYSKQSQESDYFKDIESTYKQIISNFEQYNQATNQIIEIKYKENLNSMERRIGNIKQCMQQQLKICKQLSNKNINQIKSQIEEALYYMRGIYNQNESLKEALKKERSRIKIIQNQRMLLIQEMVNKKMILLKLHEKNKEYKDIINELRSRNSRYEKNTTNMSGNLSHELRNLSNQKIQTSKKLKTLESTHNQIQYKQSYSNRKKFFEDSGNGRQNPQKVKMDLLDVKQYSMDLVKQRSESCNSQKNSKYSASRNSYIDNTSNKNSYSKIRSYSKKNSKIGCNSGVEFQNMVSKINYNNLQKKYGKKNNSKIITGNRQMDEYLLTLSRNNDELDLNEHEQEYQRSQKTIKHLKTCLQRQRKKVHEFGKIITKLQVHNEQVNNQIMGTFSEIKYKLAQRSDNTNLQTLFKYQSLIKQIFDLRNRLAVCEEPAINCGWGDPEIIKLIQKASQQPHSPTKIFT